METILHCSTVCIRLKEAFEEYESSLRYYLKQAEHFEETTCFTNMHH